MEGQAESRGPLGVIYGGGATRHAGTGQMAYHLAAKDLDRPESAPRRIPVGFLAHGIARSPNDPDLLLMFEKHGPGACAVDRRKGEVVHELSIADGRQFYGHGAFSPDGSRLYCTETDVVHGHLGYVSIRDGHDFRPLGDFPTHGLAPHDCELRDEGRTLVVTNGGSRFDAQDDPPCVTWVDVATGKLRRREVVPEPRINAGHLACTREGALALVSAPRDGLDEGGPGGISLRAADGELRTLAEPHDVVGLMRGETLSVAIHEPSQTVAATNPVGHVVTFWDLSSGALRRSLRVPNPRGVALTRDEREFVITFGGTAKVCRIDVRTLRPTDVPGNRDGFLCAITGSHVTVLDA